MMAERVAYYWTVIEQLTRVRMRKGVAYAQACVRIRCRCGTVCVKSVSDFKSRRSTRCNRCRLQRAAADGWAHSRQARERSER